MNKILHKKILINKWHEFRSDKKKMIYVISSIILIIGLFITIAATQQQQNVKSQAANDDQKEILDTLEITDQYGRPIDCVFDIITNISTCTTTFQDINIRVKNKNALSANGTANDTPSILPNPGEN